MYLKIYNCQDLCTWPSNSGGQTSANLSCIREMDRFIVNSVPILVSLLLVSSCEGQLVGAPAAAAVLPALASPVPEIPLVTPPLVAGAAAAAAATAAAAVDPAATPPVMAAAEAALPVARPSTKISDGRSTRETGAGTLNIIKARGFIGERYATKSKDGTPLTLYHVINPLANQLTLNRLPVLMFHGLGGDTSQMIAHSRNAYPRKPVLGKIRWEANDESLIFMLSNNNFDCWLIEGRGTTLNDHDVDVDINLFKGSKYWNFTLDEQAHLDLPTAVDFVLTQTQSEKLHYIGFSESTYFMFAHLAYEPTFQTKLASFTALAPVAYVSNIKGLGLPLFSALSMMPDNISFNYLPQPVIDTVGTMIRSMCTNTLMVATVCNPLSRSIVGGGEPQDASSFFMTALRSTSVKAFKHFLQQNIQKRFGMYDYGPGGNLARYGTSVAPSYDLKRITLPTIILVRGGNDFLSDPADQVTLLKGLGVRPYMDIFLPHWNHLDFLVHRKMLTEMNIPIARALFAITLKLSKGKSILRDPARPVVKVFKPVEVVLPDGNREVKIQSHLLQNWVNGAVKTIEPYSVGMVPNLGILQSLSQQVDRFGTQLNNIPGVLMKNAHNL